MPLLANALLWLFGVLFQFLLKFFDIKKAWVFGCVIITLGLLTAVYASVKACINSCVPSMPGVGGNSNALRMGFGLVFNGVTSVSISCWIAVVTACSLYIWKKKILNELIKAF